MVYDSSNKVIVLFGGSSGGGIGKNETWVFDLSTKIWTKKNPLNPPPSRYAHAMAYDSKSKTVVLFGGLEWSTKNDTWVYNVALNTWTEKKPPSSPPARSGHTMDYDSRNNVIIMFGGYSGSKFLSDTWIYNLTANTWENKTSSTSPSPRNFDKMVFDSKRGVFVLFGGQGFKGDTWTYNASTNIWTNMTPQNSPSPRQEHAMAYDSENNVVVLFGGYVGWYTIGDDTWTYDMDSNTWTNQSPLKSPPPRFYIDMAYDSQKKEMVLFGGEDEDTWTYDLKVNTWSRINTSALPVFRDEYAMVYDDANNVHVLFGGYSSGTWLSDTWLYDFSSNAWTYRMPPTSPPGRHSHAMAFDSQNKVVVLFGGNKNGNFLDDTWVYDVSRDTWTNKNPSTHPGGRWDHSMTYDRENKVVVLFGGMDSGNVPETWTYDLNLNKWTNQNPSYSPPDRMLAAMTYDCENKVVVLFGGTMYGQPLNDTWTYDVKTNNWTQKNATNSPPGASGQGMVYDETSKQVVLLAGYNFSTLRNETWVYNVSNDTWVNTNTSRSPSLINQAVMDYDVVNEAVVYYGGSDMSSSRYIRYYPSYGGIFTSSIFDTQINASWGKINWDDVLPPGTSIKIETRASSDNILWSPWIICVNNSGVPSPNGRYIQYRAWLETKNSSATPILHRVVIRYNYAVTKVEINIDNEWLQTSGTENWAYSVELMDGTYSYSMRATDTSGAQNTTVARVIVDTSPPTGTIVINDGDRYTNSTNVSLTLTYTDQISGVNKTRFSTDGTFDTEVWEDPAPSRLISIPSGDGSKTVWYQIMDNANNIFETNDTIILDRTPPTGGISINDGDDYTNSRDVMLSLSYADATSGVYQVRFSNDGVWDTEPWESPTTTKAWKLNRGEGAKTVSIQIKDTAGNIFETADGIGLDTTPPVGSMKINSGDLYTSTESVRLNVVCSDNGSGVNGVRFSNDGMVWTAWENISANKAWAVQPGDGLKTVFCQIADRAGMVTTVSGSITLDGTPPTGEIMINGDATYTSSRNIMLKLNCYDPVSGTDKACFANNDNVWSDWENMLASRNWTLMLGEGIKNVSVRVMDRAGLESTFTDSIILDTTPPVCSLEINSGAEFAVDPALILSISANDVVSGAWQMRFSNDNSSWSPWEAYAPQKTWTVQDSDGMKTIFMNVEDQAGNIATVTGKITVDRSSPKLELKSALGGELKGDVQIIVNAESPKGIARVEIKFNDGGWTEMEYNTASGSYRYIWSTKIKDNGPNSIEIRATDSYGGVTARRVAVTVSNMDITFLLLMVLTIIALGALIASMVLAVKLKKLKGAKEQVSSESPHPPQPGTAQSVPITEKKEPMPSQAVPDQKAEAAIPPQLSAPALAETQPLPIPGKCPQCGESVQPDWKACPACETALR